jgi:CBS domain containing-hemolysin-like protein
MTGKILRNLCGRLPLGLAGLLASTVTHASMFSGETLDAVADGISWVVLVIVPIVVIVVFWLVHILPEKIAEKRRHPQAKAIQTLCLLSLVFGGLLWPLAWLWAYSKPVLYKLAYGTDVTEEEPGTAEAEATAEPGAVSDAHLDEIRQLRAQLASLEARLGKGPSG